MYGPFAWETVASSCAVLGSRESLEAVSTGRVLIWSGHQHFAIAVGRHLAQRDFEVLEWRGYASARSGPELIIADIDRLPLMWWRALSALRRRNTSVGLILASSWWPSVSRMHSWRPCGYVHKPFSVHDLMRVVEDLTR